MISFNLRCQDGHVFEAWFKDGKTYDDQAAAGEVACPHCGDRSIVKAPMATRIAKARPDRQERLQAAMSQMQDKLATLRQHVEANFDNVGDRFAEEARRIHYGEADRRDIYGQATDSEAEALVDEGIDFVRIPWPQRTDS